MALTHSQRGKLGGKATLERYGTEHFSRIGRKGFIEMVRHYRLVPIGTSEFTRVKRDRPLTDAEIEKYYPQRKE